MTRPWLLSYYPLQRRLEKSGGRDLRTGFENCGDPLPDLWRIEAPQTKSGSAVNDVLAGQGPLLSRPTLREPHGRPAPRGPALLALFFRARCLSLCCIRVAYLSLTRTGAEDGPPSNRRVWCRDPEQERRRGEVRRLGRVSGA